jgi:hypothetical protein
LISRRRILAMAQSRIARSVMTLLMLVLVAGCSSGSDDAELTIDDLLGLPPEDDFRQRQERLEEHIRDCMAEGGFQYIPHPQPRYTVNLAKALIRGALIVSDDREGVETHGYGLAAGIIESNEWFDSNPNREISRALSGGELVAHSEAFDRCAREAREADGRDDQYFELSAQVNQLISELEAMIISDPRLAGMTEQWAACMNERGHSFRGLSEPRDEVMNRISAFSPDEPEEAAPFYARLLEEELVLATDDLDCREESGVADVLPGVVEEAEAAFLDQHGELLAEVHAIRTGSP